MDLLNWITAIHARLGVNIPERDYAKLSTLKTAVDYLIAAQKLVQK
jgi:acyl carrier protein